jgi:hypothetical protein
MKKPLFDKNDRYTGAAMNIDKRVYDALFPIFEEFSRQGFGIREISHIASLAVHDVETKFILNQDK